MAQGGTRKLAAIMFTDIVGFSRQMGADEARMLRLLDTHNQIIQRAVVEHYGMVIKTIGDAFLVDFPSVVHAVQCAQLIQTQFHTYNAGKEAAEQIHVRIGIHLGDVVQKDGDVFGDGVNIAARLQSLAEPDTICLSQAVYKEVEKKLALGAVVALGKPKLKNIAERFAIYALLSVPPKGLRQTLRIQRLKLSRRVGPAHRVAAVIVVLALVSAGAIAIRERYLSVPPGLPLPDTPSIVVLPFVNLSNDPTQEYFSDGLTEELTATLAQLPSLFVIARNSAFTYKGRATKVQQVGHELGVEYVLEGSVRKAADRVRVTAQLIHAATGGHLWAQSYERELRDIFALQEEIVHQVAQTLHLQLTLWERGELVGKTTSDLEAYDAYLRGRAAYWRVIHEAKQDANEQAREFCEQALAHDPAYVDAYVLLGWTYWFDWFYQWSPEAPHSLSRAEELAKKALALDASWPWAYQLLSIVYLWEKQHDRALVEGRRALALKPNDADGNLNLGWILTFAGQPEEGSQWMEKAVRLNPRQLWYLHMLGWAYGMAGRYEECIPLLKRVLTLNPDYVPGHVVLAMCYAEAGQQEEARAEGAEVLRVIPQYSLEVWKQKWPYKDPAMLERYLAALRKAGLQ